jgi:hypothetical protein
MKARLPPFPSISHTQRGSNEKAQSGQSLGQPKKS